MVEIDIGQVRPEAFGFFPRWNKAKYTGMPAEGIREYLVIENGNDERLLQSELVYKDDKPLWESWKELYSYAVDLAEAQLFGSFDLQLLTLGSESAMSSFQPQNLAQLVVNQAKKLANAESSVFSYASGWMLLKKLAPADWGKIRFSHSVTVFNKERGQFDLYIKKFLECAGTSDRPVWIAIRDLSRTPLWRFGEEPQTERLEKTLKKYTEIISRKVKALYILQNGEASDLLNQFGIKGE